MCEVTPPATIELGLDARAAGAARAFVRRRLCPVHREGLTDDVQLLVSELVANGVRHGAPPIVLRLSCHGSRGLHVAVTDAGPALPVARRPSSTEESGRGLQLVDWISDDWGVEVQDDGSKATWFTVRPARRDLGAPLAG